MTKPAKAMPVVARVAIGCAAVFLVIQLFPVNRNNPPVAPAKTMFAIEPVPSNVRSILERSCADCHSNQTVWPWYSHIAPVSWLVVHDVHEGRAKMNFSEWAAYPEKKRAHKLETICDQVSNDEMPDGKYTFIHRNARLMQEERELICAWTQNMPAH